jgi:hypothetical protein
MCVTLWMSVELHVTVYRHPPEDVEVSKYNHSEVEIELHLLLFGYINFILVISET